MNTAEQLENAHLLVIQTVNNFPEAEWDIPTLKDRWTVKEIVAHLADYEHVLQDVLNTFLAETPDTPYLSVFIRQFTDYNGDFDKVQLGERGNYTAQQVIAEYQEVQSETTGQLARIPVETLGQQGTLPWYGKGHSLNDFIGRLTGHIQLHCEEITAFRTREQQ